MTKRMDDIKPPKGERVWTAGYDADGLLLYFITSKKDTHGPFYIYKAEGDSYKKLGSGKSPLFLEDKYFFHQNGGEKE